MRCECCGTRDCQTCGSSRMKPALSGSAASCQLAAGISFLLLTDISTTMSFAFQGFGLGEYFKAQQKLTDILDTYFWGISDAPFAFLSLGQTLDEFSEEIDHLFDENSNPNSAILRSDNRPNIQQILRIASHGVLDVVGKLENLLQVTGDNRQDSSRDLFITLEVSGLRPTIVDLNDKLAFQTWKLKLFFRTSRKLDCPNTVFSIYELNADAFDFTFQGPKSNDIF